MKICPLPPDIPLLECTDEASHEVHMRVYLYLARTVDNEVVVVHLPQTLLQPGRVLYEVLHAEDKPSVRSEPANKLI